MVQAANLGFPRIGAFRELKKATERYWNGKISTAELLNTGKAIRAENFLLQQQAGIDIIPCNDFSYYDQVLDMACLLGCIPARYEHKGGNVDIDTYFAMARGNDKAHAMEMTKWYDTNYHYIVPEFEDDTVFSISSDKLFGEISESLELGIKPRPVLIGAVSFLSLGKEKGTKSKFSLLENLTDIYVAILKRLADEGIQSVQIDEPCLVTDIESEYLDAFSYVYERISLQVPEIKVILTTYFGDVKADNNLSVMISLPVAGFHLDLTAGEKNVHAINRLLIEQGRDFTLSLGLVSGRNIWKNDLESSLEIAERAVSVLGSDRVIIAPGCSLMHSPVNLENEQKLDPQIKNRMAYAKQKLDEIAIITKALNQGRDSVAKHIDESRKIIEDRKNSVALHNKEVENRMSSINEDMLKRRNDFPQRKKEQEKHICLPLYPTTSIGSFPQTDEIRKTRAAYRKSVISYDEYEKVMKKEIEDVIRFQEKIDMDVLVHGEPERNDMVEYFGEQMEGFAFTENGWVQSFGSRYVKPPVIFGDVYRKSSMTVKWSSFAQSITEKPVKGMLTGPVTILQWSFVRDDQPRSKTCYQIALAIRDEVVDLEKAGIKVIQIDEPAIREGLPLLREQWGDYLNWAVNAFRLCSSGVEDKTQIHTHMCYSEFNDIIDSIANMDADVISIEASRSDMELLDSFKEFEYPNEIGPGVYDIHSPRIPSEDEMIDLLEKARKVLNPEQIWVNPDCGLKTRKWFEVEKSLSNMVKAAYHMREQEKGKPR